MTLATPSLVFSKVSIVYTSILIHQTSSLSNTTLLVIRVLHLMTLVSSIAHMFPSRWFVPLERTPSSLRSALRPATVLLLTPSQKALPLAALLRLTPTATTEEYRFSTSCDLISQGLSEGSSEPSFFV